MRLVERRSIREQIEDGDLDLTEQDCPSCEATLYASSGRIPVYRCPGCRFEGPEAPSTVIWRAIRSRIVDR